MKTLIIGLDGATWDIMKPLLDAGRLPNISRLLGESSYGTLLSLDGYISPALWATIDTGKIPEKHGVLDFYQDSRAHVRAARVFDILAGDTGKIGLFGWYSTYPPRPNAGFTVPSPLAPGTETYPDQWATLTRLRYVNRLGEYAAIAAWLLAHGVGMSSLLAAARAALFRLTRGPREPGAYYRQLFAEAQINADAFVRLLRDHEPEFAAILFYYTDAVEHRYWKYMEPDAFGRVDPEKVQKFRHVIPGAYLLADRLVGRILGHIPQETTVVVVSDHGQKAAAEQVAGIGYRPKIEILKEIGLYDDVYPTLLCQQMTLRPVASPDENLLIELEKRFGRIVLGESERPLFEVRNPGDGTIQVHLRLEQIDAAANVIANEDVFLGDGRRMPLKEVVDLSSGTAFEGLSGAHAPNGIFIVRGPNVKKGFASSDANLTDIVPTLLALGRCPVGRDMDGAVLERIIKKDFLEDNPVTYIDTYDAQLDPPAAEVEALTSKEREELEGRLRALGYL